MTKCKRLTLRGTDTKPQQIFLVLIEKEVDGFLHVRTRRSKYEINRADIVSIEETNVDFIEYPKYPK